MADTVQEDPLDLLAQGLALVVGQVDQRKILWDYYEGRHPLLWADDEARRRHGWLFNHFADNLCRPIITARADRTRLRGFNVVVSDASLGPNDEDQTLKDVLLANIKRIQRISLFDQLQNKAHEDAWVSTKAFVTVWQPDADKPPVIYRGTSNEWAIIRDSEFPERRIAGVRVWFSRNHWRANVYTAFGIYKYKTDPRTERPIDAKFFYPLPEPEVNFLPNPTGRMPVYELQSDASPIVPASPLQDVLNKTVLDMVVIMGTHAVPQRYGTNLSPPKVDANGRVVQPFVSKPGAFWGDLKDAKFGQFAAADLEMFVTVQDSIRLEMMRTSNTPPHLLHLDAAGLAVSAEAIRILEAALVNEIRDRQVVFGDVWEDVFEHALLFLGFKDVDLESDWESASWEDPDPQTEEERASLLHALVSDGFPYWRALVKVYKYTEVEAKEIAAERDAAEISKATSAAAQFNAGFSPVL